MSKSTALLVGLFLIALFGGLAFFKPTGIAALEPILNAVVILVSAYIGFQVANNGVKGKCWNQDFYNADNGEGDK